jgi:hypothetical protein
MSPCKPSITITIVLLKISYFFSRLVFWKQHYVSKTGSFSVLRWKMWSTCFLGSFAIASQWLTLGLSKESKWVVWLTLQFSPEDGNRSSSRNVVLFSENQKMDKAQKSSIIINTRNIIILLGRAMAQAVSRRPLTAAARVLAQVNPVGFVVDKVALGQVFLRVLRFSPVNIIPPWASHFRKFKKIILSLIHSSRDGQ